MIENLVHSIPNTLPGNLLLTGIIGLSIYILCKGADRLVDSAVEVARDLGMPQITIGATIVSLGTTSPEATVSVLAAIQGEPGLAMGNGIGSVICDLALILGLAIVLCRIPIDRSILPKKSRIVFASALVLVLFAYLSPSRTLVRPMGFVLVGGLVGFLYISYRWAKKSRYGSDNNITVQESKPIWLSLILMALGLIVIFLGSHLLIPSVSLAAIRMGISKSVIAATLVAFGTSLPELMTAISAVRKGHPDLVLGNVLGADALNILFVIGLSASVVPLKIEPVFYQIQAPFMIGLLLLFQLYVIFTRDYFKRWQGLLLMGGYCLFVASQFLKSV